MPKLFKKQCWRKDPKTGERVTVESEKWYARYRDENNIVRRVSLARNKRTARKMLEDILDQVERRKAGLEDPMLDHASLPIADHLADFRKHQEAKNSTEKYIAGIEVMVQKMQKKQGWKRITEITAGSVEQFLVWLRKEKGRSVQTSNHYLGGLRTFVRWLVANKRLQTDPLLSLSKLNARTDERHQRRAFTVHEFERLIEAAGAGKTYQTLSGEDRAILYKLAAWTGFRAGELGSLTPASFNFDAEHPTVKVAAQYSKHRREDIQYLHTDLAKAMQEWIVKKRHKRSDLLFKISKRTCGVDRRPAEMLERDLHHARVKWLEESPTNDPDSDFLKYQDSEGKFLDFHALRHTFITNLSLAGVAPQMAQKLARHSDIRLTMEIYTHVDQDARVDAISRLPNPEDLGRDTTE